MGIDDSNEIIQRERSLPPVPRSASGDLQTSMASMIEQIERLSGKVGDPSSRAIRLYDLENGIVSRYFSPQSATKSKKPGSGGSRILKAPRNLQYEHLIFAIRLTWENVEEDYAYVEIWCAEDSTVIDDARKVGIATKPLEEWTHNGISTRINYTYWIRAVGWDGAVSPWCPPQGQGGLIVPAPIDKTIEEILDLLIGNLTEDHLYQELIKRIDLIDGPPDLIGSVAERLNILRGQTTSLIQALEERLESADEAMARQITTLFSQVRDNAAAIQTEKTTRATADSAMASSITQLQASVASANAAISSEASTRASKDEALTSRIDLAFSRIGETNAAIQTEQTARANADTALSSNVTTLQTKVNTNTASIQQAMTSINGIEAMYFLKTDVNGYVAGYGLRNTGSTSNFIVLADKFMIVAPGQTPKVPFVVGRVGASNTWGVGIDGGLVVNGTIIARHLDANSVTAEKIGAGQISANHIASNTIKTGHLDANSVTAEKIKAGAITADKLAAGVITADMIKAVGIQADWIKTGTLDANLIRQNGIPLSKIAAGVINNFRSGSNDLYMSAGPNDDVFIWVSWEGKRKYRRVGDTHRIEAASVKITGKISKTFTYDSVEGGGGYIAPPVGTWMDAAKGPSSISISATGLDSFQNKIIMMAFKK